ncbi:hypothetical protein MP228_004728 [Amoeboaphelidium protococcarum]|nr:hypothetical protein MP228_004728 [Amoeboaphelidium protococcarum]
MDQVPQNFFVVYILYSSHTKSYYIGSTPDPIRRLQQHNGLIVGGAKKTAKCKKSYKKDAIAPITKRPWEMVLFTYGFLDRKSCLKFEWALQHPHESKDFAYVWRQTEQSTADKSDNNERRRKRGQVRTLQECIMMLSLLLNSPKWDRWSLRVHIFTDSCAETMAIVNSSFDMSGVQKKYQQKEWINFVTWDNVIFTYGHFRSLAQDLQDRLYFDNTVVLTQYKDMIQRCFEIDCHLCGHPIDLSLPQTFVVCRKLQCQSTCHLFCMAQYFLKIEGKDMGSILLPKHGQCPKCKLDLWWADLIRGLKVRTWHKALIEGKSLENGDDSDVVSDVAFNQARISDDDDDEDELGNQDDYKDVLSTTID